MRLPVLLLGVGCAAGLLAGCTSSGRTEHPPTTPSATSVSSPVSPGTPSQTVIGQPVGTPSAIKRTVTRPAGAKQLDVGTCIKVSNVVILFIEQRMFTYTDVQMQMRELSQIAQLGDSQRADLRQARRVWLADGYPAGFPAVRDLDELITIYDGFDKAAKDSDLNAIPRLYVRLRDTNEQYLNDTHNRSVCP